MWFEDFKAGHWRKQGEYRSFSPTLVDHEWRWRDARINTLLEQASRALGALDSYAKLVPDVDLFIQMHVVKEATASSRIEGTQTTLEEALLPRERIAPERRDDHQEVQNYVQAMNESIDKLRAGRPLCNRLLLEAHATLMQGVRGENKAPGEFRRIQNRIGGATFQDAVFIPPNANELPDLMSDLEKFWHNASIDVPDLIRIAISHYQFETIHPFLDGNGRVGRLLITLYLVEKGLLAHPTLYVSSHIERHRAAYYDSLAAVRASNDLGQWVRFALVAIRDTAEQACATMRSIVDLREEVMDQVVTLGRTAPSARRLVKVLFSQPSVQLRDVETSLGISREYANRLLRTLVREGIVVEVTGRARDRVYRFERYRGLFL